MKNPAQLTKKTVFIYRSINLISPSAGKTTDPVTATATLTASSTVCIGR